MADRFTGTRRMCILVAALVFLGLMGLALPVSALNVSISQYDGNVPAGGTVNFAVQAGNSWTDEPVDLLVDVMGISQKPDLQYAAVEPIKDTYMYSARKFTSVPVNSLHVDRGENKQIILSFQLPSDVGNGGRYAMVVLHTLPGKNITASDTNIPVFLTVLGSSPKVSGSITNLGADNILVGQPLVVTTDYKNTGNIHQNKAVNTVTIAGPDGTILATNSTAPLSAAILPETTFEFSVRPDIRNLAAGTYTVTSKVLSDDRQVLDKKTATFTISEAGNSQLTATPVVQTSAPATPTKSPLTPVLGLVALTGAILMISTRQKQKR
jgi:hypothetical protein